MMKTNLKHFVEFLFPVKSGKLPIVKEVASRDLEVKAPKEGISGGCFAIINECTGYKLFDRQEAVAEDGEVLIGQRRNYSGMNYF